MGRVQLVWVTAAQRVLLAWADVAARGKLALLTTMKQIQAMTTRSTPTYEPTAPKDPVRPREEGAEFQLAMPKRSRFGLRARMLLAHVGLLAIAVLASVLVARQLLLVRLEERIDHELAQEVSELRLLAEGRDPATGEPFGTNVRRVFQVFLQRNLPTRNEVLITYVDGRPFERSTTLRAPPYRLEQDPQLTARWGRLEEADRGEISTPGGRLRFLAVPVRRAGAAPATFAVGIFRDREEEELNDAITALAGVGLALLLAGSVLAWRLAGGVLRPVRAVTSTARSISATSFERRIPEQGSDEIAQLAATFNEMLDRLEGAFDTQRHFLDDAGHELRTPLTIVRGHLETLEEDPVARRRTVDLVLDEVKRMSRMVEDLILLAQSDEPDFLRLEPVDVAGLTNDLHAKAQALGDRNWRIDALGRGIIVADRQRLTQAVVQLAQNAVQHTEEGAEIGLGSAVAPGGARFWVRDTGPGIPPEDRTRIFERFERGSSANGEGAGLGLAIVDAIARAHGGRAELDGVASAGATVSITVPTDQPEREGLPT
jgi:two-component system, OmpR family, sensor kinase